MPFQAMTHFQLKEDSKMVESGDSVLWKAFALNDSTPLKGFQMQGLQNHLHRGFDLFNSRSKSRTSYMRLWKSTNIFGAGKCAQGICGRGKQITLKFGGNARMQIKRKQTQLAGNLQSKGWNAGRGKQSRSQMKQTNDTKDFTKTKSRMN